MNAQPSAQALEGVANAQYALKMQAEAYDSYDRLLKDYATSVGTHAKAQAQARLKELAAVTGYISIRVNEAGADVSLDGKSIGQSPVAALIRVAAGPHKVDVVEGGLRPGVEDAERRRRTGKRSSTSSSRGRRRPGISSVKEKTGQPVRVLVDGADVGAAPLDVDVAPGPARGRAPELDARRRRRSSDAQEGGVAPDRARRGRFVGAHRRDDRRSQGDHLPRRKTGRRRDVRGGRRRRRPYAQGHARGLRALREDVHARRQADDERDGHAQAPGGQERGPGGGYADGRRRLRRSRRPRALRAGAARGTRSTPAAAARRPRAARPRTRSAAG